MLAVLWKSCSHARYAVLFASDHADVYAKDMSYCVMGRCYGSSHIPIEVFVVILWLVHTATTPSISVAIPFCPKDLVPFAGAPVQHPKCWDLGYVCQSTAFLQHCARSEGRLLGGGSFTDGMR